MNHSAIRRALSLLAAGAFLSASARAGVVLSGGGLALVEEGGTLAPGNLATSGTAFAKDLLPGYAAHTIPNLNDQLFGNGDSWIGDSPGTFAGISLGATPVAISSIAFGRDNTEQFTDRTLGLYTLQYTTEPNPTDATTAWTTIGTLDYQSAGGTNFASPSKRHRYTFTPVAATGIRLLVPAGGISGGTCIDELEVYPGIVVTTAADEFDTPSGTNISLREAVRDCPAGAAIGFAPALSSQPVILTTGAEIVLDKNLTLDASNLPNGITIDGGAGTNRIFSIPAARVVTLRRLTLTGGNGGGATANGSGGAIFNASSALTLDLCSFQGNSATNGGGIYNSSASPTLTHCSFQGNSAVGGSGGGGGGIQNINLSSPTLTNCSFQGNSASGDGGGISNIFSSSPTLTNCIIWRNKDRSGIGTANSSVYRFSSNPTYSHCLIQGYSKATLDNGVTNRNNFEPTDPLFVLEVDPNLAPVTGGDLRLRSASPAIDAGSNAANTTNTDLGGKPRLIDGNQDGIATIDLGAHEWRRVFVNVAVAGANQDGTSWANAFPQLQSALAAAQAGDEIWVATGTYYPDLGTGQTDDARESTFALKAGVALYGGFAGTETTLSQRNPATTPTTLSGDLLQNDGSNFADNADNAYHVLTATGATITATTLLDGFTITAGNANGTANLTTRYESGGGLFCSSSASPALNNCSFQGNSGSDLGGGIFNNSASPTLTHCSFQGNRANAGGGIYNLSASPTLTNCSFQGNSASGGGGIANNSSSAPTLTNCSFQGNSATFGGGILNNNTSSPSLHNCIIWRNKDNSGVGTANSSVFNISSTATYSHCLIQGLNPAGTGNLDGTLSSTDPLFVLEVDPNLAPVTGGDLRLRSASPAIDAGNNAANTTSTDLGGKPRLIDGNQDGIATIDLGAHEWRRVFVAASVSGGTQDGTSWANAFPHLQSALAAVQAGDEIWVATGTYYPDLGTGQTDNARESAFALKAGVALYGGFAGTETLLSQRNPANNPTTLSGDLLQNDGPNFANNADNAYHVLTATGASITATALLDGFTITAGNANGVYINETTRYESGGGLFCTASASPTVHRCTFVGNDALNGGGGVFNNFASPPITHCSFQGNRAAYGGGIVNISSSPPITHCSFQGNTAVGGGGGGIANSSSSPPLSHCSFQGNRAAYGGGILNNESSPSLTNCSFQGNSAHGDGGGILNLLDSSPPLTNCSFQGNSASGTGGGISNLISSSTPLTNCIIWRNKDNSGTGTANSSIFNDATPAHANCLVQGLNPAGTGNLDGTLPANNPLFVREVDPNLAPTTTGGDLRLLTGSPALDAGNNAANPTSTDLAGNPRIQGGTVDLGAYEGNVDATFALLHPGLSPTADANGNGIPNFGDYAAGGNPSAPDDPTLRPQLAGNQLTFSFRNNAADLTREFQKSTTLLPGSWQQLIENTDYTVTTTTSSGGRGLLTLTLTNALRSTHPKLFFRTAFESVP